MSLEVLRGEIDALDEILVRTLSRRLEICRKVALIKAESGIAMMNPDRVRQVKQRCASLGASGGVDEGLIDGIYDLIIGEACRLETRVMAEASTAAGAPR